MNAHHHYQQLLDYLEDESFGVDIDVRVESKILGTGGGIKNTSDFWDDEPFVVINSDILTNIDLARAYEHHRKRGDLATLILHDCEPFNQVQTDSNHLITEFFQKTGQGRLAFTGIHIIDPGILSQFPVDAFFDIIGCYRQLIQSRQKIRAFISENHYWHDIGSVEGYVQANKALLDYTFSIGTGCRVDPSAKLEEWVVVGDEGRIGRDVEIRRSILWEAVTIRAGVKVIDSIATSSQDVRQDLIGQIY